MIVSRTVIVEVMVVVELVVVVEVMGEGYLLGVKGDVVCWVDHHGRRHCCA